MCCTLCNMPGLKFYQVTRPFSSCLFTLGKVYYVWLPCVLVLIQINPLIAWVRVKRLAIHFTFHLCLWQIKTPSTYH